MRLSGGRGVDHVLEVGGPGTLGCSIQALAAGGHLALIGVLTGLGASEASLFPLVAKNAEVSGLYVGHAEAFAAMVRSIDRSGVRPVIDRVFSFSDVPAAYAHLSGASHFGKVVIDFDAD